MRTQAIMPNDILFLKGKKGKISNQQMTSFDKQITASNIAKGFINDVSEYYIMNPLQFPMEYLVHIHPYTAIDGYAIECELDGEKRRRTGAVLVSVESNKIYVKSGIKNAFQPNDMIVITNINQNGVVNDSDDVEYCHIETVTFSNDL